MRTYVTFCTDLFGIPTSPGPLTKDGLHLGQDGVNWLSRRLNQKDNIRANEIAVEEDYGCLFFGSVNAMDFEILMGLDTPDSTKWFIWVLSTGAYGITPTFMKWQGQSDKSEKLLLCMAVDEVLKSEPNVHSVRWHYDEWSASAKADKWANTPSAG